MAKPKADADKLKKRIRQECQDFLKEHGRKPNVREISKILHMSNNTTNDIVMEWKEEQDAAAQVINLPDEIFVKLEEGRQFQENLLRDMVAKKDRERELALNALEAEIKAKYKGDLDDALDENDRLNSQLLFKEDEIRNLKADLNKLENRLVGESSDLKLLVKTLQQQMITNANLIELPQIKQSEESKQLEAA